MREDSFKNIGMWDVTLRESTGQWEDYGSYHFCVFAKNKKLAYKRACELEDPSNIKSITFIKNVPDIV